MYTGALRILCISPAFPLVADPEAFCGGPCLEKHRTCLGRSSSQPAMGSRLALVNLWGRPTARRRPLGIGYGGGLFRPFSLAVRLRGACFA
jgi:hypothetical protein